MKRFWRYVLMGLAMVVGVGAMIFGEADDSPGLQGLGLILILGMMVWLWRMLR
jgi:hypothetical protein